MRVLVTKENVVVDFDDNIVFAKGGRLMEDYKNVLNPKPLIFGI